VWELIGSLGAVPMRLIGGNETGIGRRNSYPGRRPGDLVPARPGLHLAEGSQHPARTVAAQGQCRLVRQTGARVTDVIGQDSFKNT
jgi:hypothetical protein